MNSSVAEETQARPHAAGPPLAGTVLYRAARSFFAGVATLAFDFQAYGVENVPATGGVLLAANHESFLDPIVAGIRVRRPVSFFAKSELFENRYFGWAIRQLHAFPVRQGEGDIGAVREAIARLKEGHALGIFPEGSRTEDGRLQPVEPGVALIVRRAGVPVVPVAIDGTFQAWPRHRTVPRRWPVRAMYGKPMDLHHLKSPQIVAAIGDAWARMLTEMRATPHPAFLRRASPSHGTAPPDSPVSP